MTSINVDITRGERRGELSKQWATRADDERFLSLSDLRNQVATWADQSQDHEISPLDLAVGYDGALGENANLTIDYDGGRLNPTHYSFGQIASLANVPANYLRSDGVPPALAAACLRNGLINAARDEPERRMSAYVRHNGGNTLRALTSTRYGRIFDRDVVDSVIAVAGDGVGDTRWKIPGTIDWGKRFGNGTVRYNSEVEITKQTTTLYASDRDVWMFLCDDRNPIEVGKLPNGDPDLMFRGFYVYNSEVGDRVFGLAAMYLRAVCQNRNLWGVEGFQELTIRHTSGAPERFLDEVAPALELYANSSQSKLVEGVAEAKRLSIGNDLEERIEFMQRFGFSRKMAVGMMKQHDEDEGRLPTNVWDAAQAATAFARTLGNQDARINMELAAQKMLDRVKV